MSRVTSVPIPCNFYCCRFAEAHNCADMLTTAVTYVQNHFPHICQEEEFLDLPKDQLVSFLSSEHLRVDSEFQVSSSLPRSFYTLLSNGWFQNVYYVEMNIETNNLKTATLVRNVSIPDYSIS